MSPTAMEFLQSYQEALRRHDLEAPLAHVAPDAVYLFSHESVYRGRAEVEQAIRNNFEAIRDETFTMDNVRWLVDTEVAAVCVYDYAWSGQIDGRPATGSGRGTTVLGRRQSAWEIVHEHLSRGKFRS